MNLAKVSANGQITLPADIRKLLGIGSGDKVLFFQKSNGEIVISNASAIKPLTKQQFLDELELSREQSENGNYLEAEEALNELRNKYGI